MSSPQNDIDDHHDSTNSLNHKDRLLLKFRTITTMLSTLQTAGVPISNAHLGLGGTYTQAMESHLDLCQSQNLAAITALATVLVRDDEVVTVVTNNRVFGQPLAFLVASSSKSDSDTNTQSEVGVQASQVIPAPEIITPAPSKITEENFLEFLFDSR
jgi:hypothetical protein